jgi:pimeloyl-ACP methyl ester carboxylesterase
MQRRIYELELSDGQAEEEPLVPDLAERLSEIRAPTLVLTGDADNVVAPQNSELLAERIPGARLVVFRGGGHLFFWEQPQQFVDVVTEFLH